MLACISRISFVQFFSKFYYIYKYLVIGEQHGLERCLLPKVAPRPKRFGNSSEWDTKHTSYRGIFVYVFCPTSIRLSFSYQSAKKKKYWILQSHSQLPRSFWSAWQKGPLGTRLWILLVHCTIIFLWEIERDIQDNLWAMILWNSKFFKECVGSLAC